MADFNFNPFGSKGIIVHFDCDNCGEPVTTEEISIPSPNYSADNSADSQVEAEEDVTCTGCPRDFQVSIYVTHSGGDGSVDNLPNDSVVTYDLIPDPNDD